MGSSDPFPAGFEIPFGSLNFRAMGNDYLMRLTNREELHPWRSLRHDGNRHSGTRLGGCCERLDTSAPPALRPALAPGTHGAVLGRTHRDAGGTRPPSQRHQRGNARPQGRSSRAGCATLP
jgi:hypothetical protein